MSAEATSYTFKAEVKQVLQILIHSLYQDRDIFLRVSASEALDTISRKKMSRS